MNAARPITVREVMVCAVAHTTGAATSPFMAALGVRCALPLELAAARSAAEYPLHLNLYSATVQEDSTATTLVLGADAAFSLPKYSVTVPTAAVGLMTALEDTPVSFHVVLIDEDTALPTAFPVVGLPQMAALAQIDAQITHEALAGAVHHSLSLPLGMTMDDEQREAGEPADAFRDRFWVATSGIASRQKYGHNALQDLGATLDEFVEEHGMDHPDLYPLLHSMEVALAGAHAAGDVAAIVAAAPREVSAQSSATEVVIDRFSKGAQIREVSADYPLSTVIAGVAANLSAQAITMSEKAHGHVHPPRFIATWMSDPGTAPMWAFRGLTSTLLAHDVSLARDLIGNAHETEDGHVEHADDVAVRFLHGVFLATEGFDTTSDGMAAALNGATIRHAGHDAVVSMAATMLDARDEAGQNDCGACLAMETLAFQYPTMDALVATAAALLCYLADLHALMLALPEGDRDWAIAREKWLDATLDRVA